ncbi:MAG: hypothetical protein IJC46_07380 [Clostridia bacterium]|nr:hypothetical protein [Clostridia bacterium]
MAYDYGYGELENKLIELLRSGAPNFDTAEELIQQGADINAIGKKNDENILSEILSGYWWTARGDIIGDACDDCDEIDCDDCEHNQDLNPNLGASMCAIIHFFLDHGFDVNKCDGCFGAQCLYALTLSTFDRHMIEATKILLNAGAKNRPISPTLGDETPWDFICKESSYQSICEDSQDTANLFEAVSQIYQALEDGKPYDGIDSYETVIGKRIIKVLAEPNGNNAPIFSINLQNFKKDNCYTQTLYFVYDGGVLITTPHADFWTDTILPSLDLIDVSDHFNGIVGNTVMGFSFDYRTIVKGNAEYGQPITTIETETGCKIRFSVNYGEVKKADRAAYFELI